MNFIKKKYYQVYIKTLKLFNACEIKIAKAKYKCKNDKSLNIDNPVEFMEKIQWLKFNYYKEDFGYLVDKYEVRDYVKKIIGEQYLNDFIAIYDSEEDIDFENLPDKFALKGTHGSGYNIIVQDKNKLNWIKTKKILKEYLKKDYSKYNGEKIYKDVKPRILAEKYLDQSEDNYIIDYKFYCFHGVPKYVLVKKCFYDLEWNKISPDKIPCDYLEIEIEKPSNLKEMIQVATKLANELIFIRVDLYSINNKIVFGELTFFPTGGNKRLSIEKFNKEFGDLIDLPI